MFYILYSIYSTCGCSGLRRKGAQHANELWLLDPKDEFAFLWPHNLGVLQTEAELGPVAERQRKGGHDLRRDALCDEVLESDAHGHERLRAAAQLPELCEVDTKVCQRVHRKDNHVDEVRYLNAAPLQPLVLVRLQLFQRLRLDAESAEIAPRKVVVLHVLPGEHQDRLPEDAEQLYALQRRERHCHRRHSAHASRRRIYREQKSSFMRDASVLGEAMH
jgi:hypothetical protein